MRVEKITSSKSVEVVNQEGLKRWYKQSVRVLLDENDDKAEARKLAREEVMIGLKEQMGTEITINPEYAHLLNQQPVINKEKERIEIAIDNCQSKPELLLLQSDALKYDLIKQYINKLNSFTV